MQYMCMLEKRVAASPLNTRLFFFSIFVIVLYRYILKEALPFYCFSFFFLFQACIRPTSLSPPFFLIPHIYLSFVVCKKGRERRGGTQPAQGRARAQPKTSALLIRKVRNFSGRWSKTWSHHCYCSLMIINPQALLRNV